MPKFGKDWDERPISDVEAKNPSLPYYPCKCTSPNKSDTTPPSSGILTQDDTAVFGEA